MQLSVRMKDFAVETPGYVAGLEQSANSPCVNSLSQSFCSMHLWWPLLFARLAGDTPGVP